ncbi:hypothetical protein ACD591_04960 [Rufibacter glacialis]|uniref:Uncharacterized protein n=1 Tax=Rufibacter glacialis TaxID=1259555 RepID=A0A5M8QHS7_9BACT|nr:hypothetical protein [Rufibacter glacialis]KAA6434701.1 hypothetical protein FOE74_11015 [Rufibacter glacialis]GGK71708.1 hypothetical protein GCM10011405_19920 [Rufibacter glacialis]
MNSYTIEQQVQEMQAAGLSIRGIASELGIDKSKVQRILRKLLETSFLDSDTENDTLFDTGFDTADTRIDTLIDTPYDTGETARNTASDTPFDTYNHAKRGLKISEREPVSHKVSYTLAEAKLLMMQTALLKDDIHDFLSEFIELHSMDTLIDVSAYSFYVRRVKRLIQYTKILAFQLEDGTETLPAVKALREIESTMQHILSGPERFMEDKTHRIDMKPRDMHVWQSFLYTDFFQPII